MWPITQNTNYNLKLNFFTKLVRKKLTFEKKKTPKIIIMNT